MQLPFGPMALLLLFPLAAGAVQPVEVKPAPIQPAPIQRAIVLKVENGQVLAVRIGPDVRRVRLACVQAPRPVQEPWSWQASQALRRLAPLGSAIDIDLRARDVFGRLVAVVRRNGRDIAPALLRQGAVFATDGYLGQCSDLPYAAAEAQARRARIGVWRSPGGIERPWNLLERQGSSGGEP